MKIVQGQGPQTFPRSIVYKGDVIKEKCKVDLKEGHIYGKCGVRCGTQRTFVFVVTSTCSKSFSHIHFPYLSFLFSASIL
jgi:hypothetical protein